MSGGLRGLLRADAALIGLFGLSSGIYKLVGGEADVRLYGAAGIAPGAMAAVGLVQALAGAAVLAGLRVPGALRAGAPVLAAVNLLASWVLFRNGVQPFGAISLLFVGMALAPLALARSPGPGAQATVP